MRKSNARLKTPIHKSKNYTKNIAFPNCNTILYVLVLSIQKYKNIDLKLDFLNS